MKNRYVFGGVAALAVLPVLYVLFPKQASSDSILGCETWPPTAAEIAAAVGSGGAGRFDDERHTRFAEMFKSRFREKQIAVGVKFEDDRVVRLLCAAVIPRWDMARIATQLSNEAKTAFGRAYRVDIYETYISSAHRKVAEGEWDEKSERVQILFREFPYSSMDLQREMRSFRPFVLNAWFRQLPQPARRLVFMPRRMTPPAMAPEMLRPAIRP